MENTTGVNGGPKNEHCNNNNNISSPDSSTKRKGLSPSHSSTPSSAQKKANKKQKTSPLYRKPKHHSQNGGDNDSSEDEEKVCVYIHVYCLSTVVLLCSSHCLCMGLCIYKYVRTYVCIIHIYIYIYTCNRYFKTLKRREALEQREHQANKELREKWEQVNY